MHFLRAMLMLSKPSLSCASPTNIRKAGARRMQFILLDGLAYDLEGLGTGAGHKKKKTFAK
ncbi:hypothetical protein DZB84_08285 [Bacillus sp. HNG]|nr:hypothetical protein DZB84_08285 [Bacillus sp. HNG]